MSKLNGVFWSTRSSAVSGSSRWLQRSRFEIARWLFIAPFGRPVEPEV